MEERIDTLIEEIETMSTEINKLNFDIEGLQEELTRLEENQPFMVRKIQASERKLTKLTTRALELQMQKRDLDAEYGAIQLKKSNETLEKVKKTNPNEDKKESKAKIEEEPIKDEEFGY